MTIMADVHVVTMLVLSARVANYSQEQKTRTLSILILWPLTVYAHSGLNACLQSPVTEMLLPTTATLCDLHSLQWMVCPFDELFAVYWPGKCLLRLRWFGTLLVKILLLSDLPHFHFTSSPFQEAFGNSTENEITFSARLIWASQTCWKCPYPWFYAENVISFKLFFYRIGQSYSFLNCIFQTLIVDTAHKQNFVGIWQ